MEKRKNRMKKNIYSSMLFSTLGIGIILFVFSFTFTDSTSASTVTTLKHPKLKHTSSRDIASIWDWVWGSSDDKGEPNWKLLYAQLFALEMKKSMPQARNNSERLDQQKKLTDDVMKYIRYTPKTFYQAEIEIMSKAKNSYEYQLWRKKMWEDPKNFKDILSGDLNRSIPKGLRKNPAIDRFVSTIEQNRDRKIVSGENFFKTPEGGNIQWGLTYRGEGANPQDVVLVLIPGYAAHTIKFAILEEFVRMANLYHGRPKDRPMDKDGYLLFKPQTSQIFYNPPLKESISGAGIVDVLHPAGEEEMGNTVGPNELNGDHMYKWLSNLPKQYENKKLILFGYSKGGPAILEMLEKYPDLRRRVAGVITFAAVHQGTGIARDALEQITKISGKNNLDDAIVEMVEMIKKLKDQDSKEIANLIQSLMGENKFISVAQLVPLIDVVKEFVDNFANKEDANKIGLDLEKLKKEGNELLDTKDFVKEMILGVRDLSPKHRTKWNLLNMNNSVFDKPIFYMNMSALTDVERFVNPHKFIYQGERKDGVPMVPVLSRKNGKLAADFTKYSIDSDFLYFSSLGGFMTAAAGLFDTQVEMSHTKSFLLDGRPLSASLTKKELQELWNDRDVRNFLQKNSPEIDTIEKFSNNPRNTLVPKEIFSNIKSIDISDFGGTHWDFTMKQAFSATDTLAPNGGFEWEFPRDAAMRALVQLLALHNIYQTMLSNE
ncbi:MAG: hypothetical protein HQK49_09800 [Oligoflexia bacterium]|nr:hypothetical protein [Oligoflexia bacterium]